MTLKRWDWNWYRSRINRYIMECKCDFTLTQVAALPELIDTLWNVNV